MSRVSESGQHLSLDGTKQRTKTPYRKKLLRHCRSTSLVVRLQARGLKLNTETGGPPTHWNPSDVLKRHRTLVPRRKRRVDEKGPPNTPSVPFPGNAIKSMTQCSVGRVGPPRLPFDRRTQGDKFYRIRQLGIPDRPGLSIGLGVFGSHLQKERSMAFM